MSSEYIVIDYVEPGDRIVLSRKKPVEETKTIVEGEVYDGIVIGATEKGAFVEPTCTGKIDAKALTMQIEYLGFQIIEKTWNMLL